MSLLHVKRIGKKYNESFIVKDVTFSLQAGRKLALAGETGSGKSTLLKIIAGLVQADRGEVLFENDRVKGPDETLVPGHSHIAYLSQLFELPKFLRVEQVLNYSNTLSEKETVKIFKFCQIQHLLKRKTDELSGGERQRIALAKQLLAQPILLLLVEPYSNLDIIHKNILKAVIDDLTQHMQITCLLVSHDPLDILSWADEILVMKKGRIVQQGSPQTVYTQPTDEYVAGLFGKFTIVSSAQFKALTGSRSKGPIIIRPEQFSVHTAGKNGIRGTIRSVQFYGSFFELEVITKNQPFFVQVLENTFSTRDSVIVKLRKTK